MGVMYWVYGLWLGPNFIVWQVADKNFYLRLKIEKVHAFAVFNDFNLRPYGCCDTNFTATVNCKNPKTEILNEIIEIQNIGIQFNFFFLC